MAPEADGARRGREHGREDEGAAVEGGAAVDGHPPQAQPRLGVDVGVILPRPCMFCMENH